MIRLPWLDDFVFYSLLITLFVIPFSITFNEIFMALTILSWSVKLIVRREKIEIPPLGWFFLVFLLTSIVSALASDYKNQALRGVWDISRYTITFFIVINTIHSVDQIKKIFWTFVVSTGLWVIAGIIHQFLIVKRVFFDLLQFFSLGNKNAIGQYLQMTLAIILGVFLNNLWRPKEKAILIAVILVSLLGLFLSSSKTMWIAFIITLLVFAFLKKSRIIIIGIGALLGIFLIAAAMIPQVQIMGSHILKGLEAPSMQERFVGWQQSYSMFNENPILGVGPKCYMVSKDRYQIIPTFGQAHNMILHVACEMGIVGVVGLISWIIFYLYFMATYRKKVASPMFLGLWYGGVGYIVTLAIGGITEPTIGHEHSQLFMVLVGLLHVGLKSKGENQGMKS